MLTLPKHYIFDQNKVRTEQGVVEVKLGIQNLERVEIISGITEDTWILTPD